MGLIPNKDSDFFLPPHARDNHIFLKVQYSISKSLKHTLLLESIPVFRSIASTTAIVDVKDCKSPGCEILFLEVQDR